MATQSDIEQLPGVGPATADKLSDAGYDTYNGLAVSSPANSPTPPTSAKALRPILSTPPVKLPTSVASRAVQRFSNAATKSASSPQVCPPSTIFSAAESKPSQ